MPFLNPAEVSEILLLVHMCLPLNSIEQLFFIFLGILDAVCRPASFQGVSSCLHSYYHLPAHRCFLCSHTIPKFYGVNVISNSRVGGTA